MTKINFSWPKKACESRKKKDRWCSFDVLLITDRAVVFVLSVPRTHRCTREECYQPRPIHINKRTFSCLQASEMHSGSKILTDTARPEEPALELNAVVSSGALTWVKYLRAGRYVKDGINLLVRRRRVLCFYRSMGRWSEFDVLSKGETFEILVGQVCFCESQWRPVTKSWRSCDGKVDSLGFNRQSTRTSAKEEPFGTSGIWVVVGDAWVRRCCWTRMWKTQDESSDKCGAVGGHAPAQAAASARMECHDRKSAIWAFKSRQLTSGLL